MATRKETGGGVPELRSKMAEHDPYKPLNGGNAVWLPFSAEQLFPTMRLSYKSRSAALQCAAGIAIGALLLRLSRRTREKLQRLHEKGMLLDTLRGVWPQRLQLENRPAMWGELDVAQKVEEPVVLTGSSIMRLWSDAAQHLAPLPLMNRAFGGSCTWNWVRGGGHGEPGRQVAAYHPSGESTIRIPSNYSRTSAPLSHLFPLWFSGGALLRLERHWVRV